MSRRVEVDVEYAEDENDSGVPVDAVVVICTECGRETSAYGTSGASIRRACVKLRDECGSDFFYYTDEV